MVKILLIFKHSAWLLRFQLSDFPFFIPALWQLTENFLFILRVLKFYQMCLDAGLFSFILHGIRWAPLIWNLLSFFSSWNFNYFFQYFSPSHFLYFTSKTNVYRCENFVIYFPYLSIFPDLLFFHFISRVLHL